jgi:hypothetical protein
MASRQRKRVASIAHRAIKHGVMWLWRINVSLINGYAKKAQLSKLKA